MTTTTINLDELNKLAGLRHDGYTSEDVGSTSDRLQVDAQLGYGWAVIWDYFDRYGTGGSSEEFLRDPESGELYEQPTFLYELLFEGVPATAETVAEGMAALKPREVSENGLTLAQLVALDGANYAVRVTTGDGRYL